MKGKLKEAAEVLKGHLEGGKPIRIIGHDDADGLSAASILHATVERSGCPAQTRCTKQLDGEMIKALSKEKLELVLFTDLGSGQLDSMKRHLLKSCKVIVLDHHQPKEIEHENLSHVNPHEHGIDGTVEISGAGVAYLFSRAVSSKNVDLSHLAIIGALGDMQDPEGELRGPNKEILKDAERAGVLKVEKDLRLFGRQTRALHKAIEYTNEPFIPGLSGNESACVQFLSDIDIPVKENGKARTLADLKEEERRKLNTALILKMIEHGVASKTAEKIVGEVYTLPHEEEKTSLRDAKEYATLLNACGRHEKYGIGIGICLGDRERMYKNALDLLKKHKEYISSCYMWVYNNLDRVEDRDSIYFIHAHSEVDENVIGTLASMVLNSRMLNPLKPVVAMGDSKERGIKVSSRGTREMVESGLNLGDAMRLAAEGIGGEGGGHDIAAGAQIEPGKEDEFLKLVAKKVKEQGF